MTPKTRISKVFLTGQPGIGKTTLILKLYNHLVESGVMVSGMITEEARTGGVRTGFKIRSLASGQEGWLAAKIVQDGPRIGSYFVNTSDLERIGAEGLESAARGDALVVLVDEVGPMEMTSPMFRRALTEVLSSSKIVVASVKYRSKYPEIEEASRLEGTVRMTITQQNRDSMFSDLKEMIIKTTG